MTKRNSKELLIKGGKEMIRARACISLECKKDIMLIPKGHGIKGGLKVIMTTSMKPIVVIGITKKNIDGPCRINIKDGFDLAMDYDGDVLTIFTLFEYLKCILFKKKGDKNDKSTKRR